MASVNFPSNSSFSFQWCNSIRLIDISEWRTIFGEKGVKSYNLFLATEDSNFKGVNHCYLKIYKKGKIASILPCFDFNMNVIALLNNNKKLPVFWRQIQKLLPDLLNPKILTVGLYIANFHDFIKIKSDTENDFKEIRKIINQELMKKEKEIDAQLVFVRDIRESEIGRVKNALNKKFHFYRSFPTTIIPVGGKFSPYPAGLKSEYRQRYEEAKEQFEQNFHWEVVDDFSEYIELRDNLQLKVLNKTRYRIEKEQNNNFFFNVKKRFPTQSFLIVAKDKLGEIRVMNLLLEEEDKLHSLYYSIKSKKEDDSILYLNSMYKTVEIAEAKGKKYVELGQMLYELKIQSGALIDNIYHGFSSSNMVRHFFTKKILKYLVPPINSFPVYEEELEHELNKRLQGKGFCI
jgi:hypothetical protein